ncbi:MAG: matrixin family metalloprotease [Planctomycetes bacterium]|nr:matrixin family metalloprotease [Planctomycetota bacterium]
MRTQILFRTACASAALGLAGLVCLPPEALGYAFLGGSLRLAQRDVRVFNNFSDPEANANTQPDPDFPGAIGAPLAIWKAAVEWGSQRHGTGLGDPNNMDGLGSGGADFDFSWQGETNTVGGTNENIVSELVGTSGGIYAFCETPIADGWRIRFYSDAAVWHDSPDSPPPGNTHKDIQGVATHELGHALGLDHSNIPEATMLGALIGSGVTWRSLAPDDQAGVQALYGARSAGKPEIAALFVPAPLVLVVAGLNFAANGNELWFPDGSVGADGTPLVIGGLPSDATRTRITCVLPPNAAAGDVLVHVPGQSGATLSNAFPFEPGQPSCPPIVAYGTPKTTSQATLPALYWSGRPTLTTDDFVIGTTGGIPNANCVLLSGTQRANLPFQGGTLYLGGALRRYPPATLDFFGGIELHVPVAPALVGTRRFYQLWFADAGDAFGVGLSDALQVYFCP